MPDHPHDHAHDEHDHPHEDDHSHGSHGQVRWLGRRLYAEVNIAVKPDLSVEAGHKIALDVQHELLHHLRYLSAATNHVDPANASGEAHHRIAEHTHDDLPVHSH